jgi:hypothetical protein
MDFSIRRDVIEVQKADKGRIPRRQIAKSDFEKVFDKECEKIGKPHSTYHIEEVAK